VTNPGPRLRYVRRAACAALLVCVFGAPAWALTGTLLDADGKPIRGATVCYFAGEAELFCARTSDAGFFELPDSRLDTLRLSADGFLPKFVRAVERDEPVVLERAAILVARVRDAKTKEPLDAGDLLVVYPSGVREGPFPFNANGVRVKTMQPGAVRIVARAVGYVDSEPQALELVAGKETETRLDLVRFTAAPAE
jgi:hypothetical protein